MSEKQQNKQSKANGGSVTPSKFVQKKEFSSATKPSFSSLEKDIEKEAEAAKAQAEREARAQAKRIAKEAAKAAIASEHANNATGGKAELKIASPVADVTHVRLMSTAPMPSPCSG